jgi:hypothetical protein
MAKKKKKGCGNGSLSAGPFQPTFEALAPLVAALPDPEPDPAVQRVFEQFRGLLSRLRETPGGPEKPSDPGAAAAFRPTLEAMAVLVDALPDPEPPPAVRRVFEVVRARLSQATQTVGAFCNGPSYSPLGPDSLEEEGLEVRRPGATGPRPPNRYCPNVETLENRNATSFFGTASVLTAGFLSGAGDFLSAVVYPILQAVPGFVRVVPSDADQAELGLGRLSQAEYPDLESPWEMAARARPDFAVATHWGQGWGHDGNSLSPLYSGSVADVGLLDEYFGPEKGCFSVSLIGES